MKYKYGNNLKGMPSVLNNFDVDNKIINACYDALDFYSNHMETLYDTKKITIDIKGYQDYELKCIVIEPNNDIINDSCIIYFHGGGFYYEMSPFMIKVASYLSSNLNCKVFIPKYRTSKVENFPIPVEDCYYSAKYIYDHSDELGINKDKIVLYGESAGGNFSASVSLMNRDRCDFKIKGQVLIYPALDYKLESKSAYKYDDVVWNRERAKKAWDIYLGDGKISNIGYASPIYAKELSNLPDAYIEAHEIDCFFDDGVKYANLLKKNKNDVILNVVKGSYHGVETEFNNSFVQDLLKNRCNVINNLLKK